MVLIDRSSRAFLVILVAALGCGCGSSNWVADKLVNGWTRPFPAGSRTPADYNVPYRDVVLRTSDGVRLQAWYIPHPDSRGRTLIICHGLGDHRLGALGIGLALRKQGPFNVLVYDMRRHGQSDKTHFTYGYHERKDVAAAVAYLEKTVKPRPKIGIIGWSAGGAVAMMSAADEPKIKAVVAINTFAELREEIQRRKPGSLPSLVMQGGIRKAESLANFKVAEVSPLKAAARIKAPLFLIAGDRDRTIDPRCTLRMARAADPDRMTMWILRGYGHADWWRHPEFNTRVTRFFRKALD